MINEMERTWKNTVMTNVLPRNLPAETEENHEKPQSVLPVSEAVSRTANNESGKFIRVSEISGSHGGEYEDDSFLEYQLLRDHTAKYPKGLSTV
jgi:hypothetical protein